MNSWVNAQRMKNFMVRKDAVERLLHRIPKDAELSSKLGEEVLCAVAYLFEEACRASGTALAVASKILHRKRPLLIPMLDNVVVNMHYWKALCGANPPAWFDRTWLKTGASSDPTQYMRLMGDEIDANKSALAQLRKRLASLVPSTISDVRLLEVTLYADLVDMARPTASSQSEATL